jgi:hypothetical protein
VSASDLLNLQPLAHSWARHGENLAESVELLRRQAAAMSWRSPAGRAAATSVDLTLAAARRCEQACSDLAQALARHREAALRYAEALESAEKLTLAPAHLVFEVVRRLA